MIAAIRTRLATLRALLRRGSRVAIGAVVAFLATAVPIAAEQLPGVQQAVDGLPLPPATRAAIQTALQIAGALLALWGRVDDAIARRNAAARLEAPR